MGILARFAVLAPLVVVLLGAAGDGAGPRFTADGSLVPPADYREWVFLSSGMDMSYTAAPPMQGQSMFDNIFADPVSWQSFKRTGHWPDHTMLVMEARGGTGHGSINRNGQYQTEDLMGIEVHVRDDARFKGGWAFFTVDGAAPAKMVPFTARCYSCHAEHGALDTTFTQFYPTARAIAEKSGTLLAR
jgi:hypothetical protein